MARRVNDAVWGQWRKRIARQRASGLSIAAFCEREGVSPATFHAWKRKLGMAASARPASRRAAMSRPGAASRPSAPSRPGVASRSGTALRPGAALRTGVAARADVQSPTGAPVSGAGPRRAAVRQRRSRNTSPTRGATPARPSDFLQLPVRSVRSSPWIELTLIDGTLVRIPQENLAALTTLLRVLRGEGFEARFDEADHA
jgi:hypothetical protein